MLKLMYLKRLSIVYMISDIIIFLLYPWNIAETDRHAINAGMQMEMEVLPS